MFLVSHIRWISDIYNLYSIKVPHYSSLTKRWAIHNYKSDYRTTNHTINIFIGQVCLTNLRILTPVSGSPVMREITETFKDIQVTLHD